MSDICERCFKPLSEGDHGWMVCPFEPRKTGMGVIGDDIPGGLEIRHGLVHEDGSPMKFYSKSAIEKEAKKRGLVNRVEHTTPPGSDKAPHTTRWY